MSYHYNILGCPQWLQKWMSIVLKFVAQEKEVVVNARKAKLNPDDLQVAISS